ncbi:MAG: alkaline phosphatase [Phycisphaerae bacterium]|nr:alkaline phosphatase [Phycisphaerae bacterium]
MSSTRMQWAFGRILFVLAILTVTAAGALGAAARNIVLLIVDGAGYNAYHCSSYYEYGETGKQPYDSFPVRLACTTGAYDAPVYDPEKSWSDFKSLRSKATDSAAAATALYTGVKTASYHIATDPDNRPLTTIAEIAHAMGKSTGAVSSVPFSHATPAAVFAHNKDRKNTGEIANEIVYRSGLTVVFGAGHPRYDDNGRRRPRGQSKDDYCPDAVYQALADGTTGKGWAFLESSDAMEALAAEARPELRRVFGLAPCTSSLQYRRDGKGPGGLNGNMPTLETMSLAALNVLSRDEDGFFLMIEGGAVDWANHDKNLARMLEEYADFNRTVAAVMRRLQEGGILEDTLVIVVSDHECGQIWGPSAGEESDTPFDLPVNRGKGNLPAAKYFSGGHTNGLVPLFATGPGSEFFHARVRGVDRHAAKAWCISGQYVDNTDVFTVMKAAITD